MGKIDWTSVSKKDVEKAIQIFLAENPEYPSPRSTFLLYEGKKLPAKHIRGMAYKVANDIEVSKSDYAGGMETVRFFERLGFDVYYTGTGKSCPEAREDKKTITEGETVCEKKEERQTPPKAKPQTIKSNSSGKEKIRIPSGKVIEQKNALQLLLNKMFDGDIVCEKTYPWLKTPETISEPFLRVYEALSNYRGDTTFAKKNVVLRCDFVCEGRKLIIEYDERQHFSEARKVSLESYMDIPVLFDRNLWIEACSDIKAKDNAPANRDEVRAYYDSTRDIACFQNGYKLVRIMHGQIDFEQPEAADRLKQLLDEAVGMPEIVEDFISEPTETVKVAMYLQTDEMKNRKQFDKISAVMKSSEADIIVFPEYCYVPFVNEIVDTDIFDAGDNERVLDLCLNFSRDLGKAVIVSSHDKYDTIFSIFANANATDDETEVSLYIKHTMAGSSCLDLEDYRDVAPAIFEPIAFKGFLIGMTICYDCNHALFSRMYGFYGIDLIINSTGGNVVYDKWFKYNKARAIENNCYTLVTMGGNGSVENPHNYVFGFNKNGGVIKPINLNGSSEALNISGGLYLYEITKQPGKAQRDDSNQFETENKNWQLKYLVGQTEKMLTQSEKVTEQIYHLKVGKYDVLFLLVDGLDILRPELVQPLLYAEEIKKYNNRRYVIVNRHSHIDRAFFEEKLSVVLKVRAMENFCAVVLESENYHKCYQCGKNRTAQVVKQTSDFFGIDLERTSGPEAIWKNKDGMRASWRKNYEWLVHNAMTLYDEN